MPIFDIEGMVKKEIDKARDIEKKMRALLESGKIEEWCGGCADITEAAKNTMGDDIRRVDRYRLILTDLLDGYRTAREAENFDKWEERIKYECDAVMRCDSKARITPPEGD